MSRQYSINDIAKYKAGSGYGDWIANLNDIKGNGNTFSGRPTGREPTRVTKFLRRYGGLQIDSIYVGRELSEDESRVNLFFQLLCYNQNDTIPILLYRENKVRIEIGLKQRDLYKLPRNMFTYSTLRTFVRYDETPNTWNPTANSDYDYIVERTQAHNLGTSNLQDFIDYALRLNRQGNANMYAIPLRDPTMAIADGIPAGEQIAEVVIDEDDPPQEGSGYYEWQRNIAKLKKVRSTKLKGGAYESVLADHGNQIIERLFLMKAHNLYLMTIITNSNNIGLYFDGQPTLFVEARSGNNSDNSQNRIEIPLKSKPLTLRKFMTKHSKPDDRFRNSYEYMFDRLFSNDLISNSDISDFLALPKPYYEGYDPNPEPSELERPD